MPQKSMLFIITAILCLSISCADNKTPYYRLPKVIRAIAYNLHIIVNMDSGTFEGDLLFEFNVLIPTKSIELHKFKSLKIKDEISLTLKGEIDKLPIKSYQENEYVLIINFEKELDPELRYWLNIPKFEGVLNQHQTGFFSYNYVDGTGKKSKFAAALLKPTYARTVFPCLDEPDQKAKFKISITRPNDYNAVSNGLKIKSTPVGTKMTRDDFEETPVMATFLVSFVISQLSLSEKVVNVHHAIAQKSALARQQTDYSIEAVDIILMKFEQYVGIKYPLNHLYHLAVPMDLSSNMVLASWGLVVYKDSFFLFTKPTEIQKETMTVLLAHEIAHLYFENLVTPKWWRYVWFQEGLSDYLSYKLVDKIHPHWLVMTKFKLKLLEALERDSSIYTEALESQEQTPLEIHYNTHIIIRPKGAAMMYMLAAMVTPAVLQNGIKKFLKNNAYKNVEPRDLYNAIENFQTVKILPQKIEFVMWTWTTQVGYPIVQVTRKYGFDTNITLEQKRFSLKHPFSKLEMSNWIIPINYVTQNNPNFSDLRPSAWLNCGSINIPVKDLKDSNSWLLVNKQGAYFYRVNYDEKNWLLIIKALKENHTSIDVFHRMQLIDDCNALAQAGVIRYNILLRMLQYFPQETEYGPLTVLNKISISLKNRLSGTFAEKYIYKYFEKPLEAKYDLLQKNPNSTTDHSLSIKLKLLFTWLCQLNYTRCTSETQLYYSKFKSGGNIPPELEEQVFCNSLRLKKGSSWNTMFSQIKSSENDEFEGNRFLALACTEDKKSLEKYLNYAKTLSSDRLALALIAVSGQGPVARRVLTDFSIKTMNNLTLLVGTKMMEAVLSNVGSSIHSKSKFREFKKIADQEPTHRHLFESAFELAESNIKWRSQRLQEVIEFLQQPILSSSGSTYYLALLNIFVVVLHTLFIAFLN